MSDLKLEVLVPKEHDEEAGIVVSSSVNGELTTPGKDDSSVVSVHSSIGSFATNPERRAVGDRFPRGSQTSYAENSREEKRDHGSGKKSGPLLAGAAYCVSSCSMILLNKVVLSSYNFNAGTSLMLYQNFICCLVVALLGLFRVVTVEKLNWKLVKLWIPVNLIFVGMLVSGMYRYETGFRTGNGRKNVQSWI
ncbi:GDP-mannose transporter GONST2 [Linum perenne]